MSTPDKKEDKGKSITLNVPLETYEEYKKAEEQLKVLFGFTIGIPAIMALSLAKDNFNDIVNDFGARVQAGIKRSKESKPSKESV